MTKVCDHKLKVELVVPFRDFSQIKIHQERVDHWFQQTVFLFMGMKDERVEKGESM